MADGLKRALPVTFGYLAVAAILLSGSRYFEPVRVAGGSMRPALVEGDIVIVRREGRVAPGAIALVREPGHSAVLHRVLEVNENGTLKLKGDANPVADFDDVDVRHVAGSVARVIPTGTLLGWWRRR